MILRSILLHKKAMMGAAALCILLLALLFLRWPFSESLEKMSRGVVLVESRSYFSVTAAPGDTLFMRPEDDGYVLETLSDSPDSVACYRYGSGFFVSENGQVATSANLLCPVSEELSLRGDTLLAVMERKNARLDTVYLQLKGQLNELNYYAGTHSPVDDGYQTVLEYRREVENALSHLDTLRLRLKRMLKEKNMKAVPHYSFRYFHNRELDSAHVVSAVYGARLEARLDSSLLLLETQDNALPAHAHHFRLYLWPADHWPLTDRHRTLLAFQQCALPLEALPVLLPDAMDLSAEKYPRFPLATGGVVVNASGRMTGLMDSGGIVGAQKVSTLLESSGQTMWRRFTAWLLSWTRKTEAAARPLSVDTLRLPAPPQRNFASKTLPGNMYEVTSGTTPYKGAVSNGRRHGSGMQTYADGAVYCGQWKNGVRAGYGVLTDGNGGEYAGVWQADTLSYGQVRLTDGQYRGHLDRKGQRAGWGLLLTPSGGRYYGEWQADMRNGFGFSVEADRMVRCGVWQANQFKGEHMIYTPHRVYGIDISRYQHEVGRKRYAIAWNRLRITRLAASVRRTQGSVDYPVSFVYIKATQGTSISSRYHAADAAAARRQGIAVGSYHFFSMKPGNLQARFFLKKARPRKGDLPPMLDVELTDRQIAKMGGRDAMFHHMLLWLRAVGRHCGTDPVLYVSQRFVNRYMPYAPAELKKYKVWIARYGEYKPYVRLQYWQLSPTGSVTGIHGHVDINVFNGTREHFEEMRRRDCVR